jgi:hypothetical protein
VVLAIAIDIISTFADLCLLDGARLAVSQWLCWRGTAFRSDPAFALQIAVST